MNRKTDSDAGEEHDPSHDLLLIALYRRFSQDTYAASWMTDERKRIGEFSRYIADRITDAEHFPPLQSYELDALPLLRDAAERAGASPEQMRKTLLTPKVLLSYTE